MYAFRYAGFTLLTNHFTRKSILRRDREMLCNLFLTPVPGFHKKKKNKNKLVYKVSLANPA